MDCFNKDSYLIDDKNKSLLQGGVCPTTSRKRQRRTGFGLFFWGMLEGGGVMKDLCEMQQETGLKKRMRVHALVKNAVSGRPYLRTVSGCAGSHTDCEMVGGGGGSPKAEAARSCHGATIEQCLCSPLCPCCSCNPRGQEINKDKAWHSSRLGELYLGPAMGKSLNHSYVDGPLICCKSGCVRCDGLWEWSAGPNDTAPRSTENTRRRCALICHRKRIHRNGSRG